MGFLRDIFYRNGCYWATTYIELVRISNEADLPYRPLKVPRKPKGKVSEIPRDKTLADEMACYVEKSFRDKEEEEAKLAREQEEKAEIEAGHTFECGCCFDEVGLSKAIQCVEAHLFCQDCARRNVEHILGNRGAVSPSLAQNAELRVVLTALHAQVITCMDQSGCKAPFTDAVLSTFMKTPQLLLLEKIRSEKAVEAAGLAGLSYCPHCSFGCVIDNPGKMVRVSLTFLSMSLTSYNRRKVILLP